jgi:uncharacterized membrane protein
MKKAISVFLQFLLFFVIFFAFTLLDPFHMKWFVTHPTHTSTRYFVPDGLIVTFALYFLFILVEALTKKFPQRAPWTTLAFLLALVLGLLSKFGFATHDLF